jgi:hypothetical protein
MATESLEHFRGFSFGGGSASPIARRRAFDRACGKMSVHRAFTKLNRWNRK